MKIFNFWALSKSKFNHYPSNENYIRYLHQHYNIVKEDDLDDSFNLEVYFTPIKKTLVKHLAKKELYSREEKVYFNFLTILNDKNQTARLYYYLINKPTDYKDAYDYITNSEKFSKKIEKSIIEPQENKQSYDCLDDLYIDCKSVNDDIDAILNTEGRIIQINQKN